MPQTMSHSGSPVKCSQLYKRHSLPHPPRLGYATMSRKREGIFFPRCCNKMPDRQFKEAIKNRVLAHGSRVPFIMAETRLQKHRTASHPASGLEVRDECLALSSLLPFYSVWGPSLWNGATNSQSGSSHFSPIQISPLRHAEVCLLQDSKSC